MTLDDLERQKGVFDDFWAATRLYHSQGGATEVSLCDPDREFVICVLT